MSAKPKVNRHGGIRERTDITEQQKQLVAHVRADAWPDAFWWGVPGRPANRLYLSRAYGISTYLDFQDGATLATPSFGTTNATDAAQRLELAEKALPAFRLALALGPEGEAAAIELDRQVTNWKEGLTP